MAFKKWKAGLVSKTAQWDTASCKVSLYIMISSVPEEMQGKGAWTNTRVLLRWGWVAPN